MERSQEIFFKTKEEALEYISKIIGDELVIELRLNKVMYNNIIQNWLVRVTFR